MESSPLLRACYEHIDSKLTEFFLAYKVVSSGVVGRSEGTAETMLKTGISIAGEFIPIPGVAAIIDAVADVVVSSAFDRAEMPKYEYVSKLVRNMHVLGAVTVATARLVTFQYEQQVLALKDEDTATLFAECIVGRFIKLMRDYQIQGADPLAVQLCTKLSTYRTHEGTWPFKDRELLGSEAGVKYTDKVLLQDCGVVDRGGVVYAIKGKESACIELGCRLGRGAPGSGPSVEWIVVPAAVEPHALGENLYRFEVEDCAPTAAATPTAPRRARIVLQPAGAPVSSTAELAATPSPPPQASQPLVETQGGDASAGVVVSPSNVHTAAGTDVIVSPRQVPCTKVCVVM